MAKEDKVQKQTRRPKVKGKTYAKVNAFILKVKHIADEIAGCRRCYSNSIKTCKCETFRASLIPGNLRRKELCTECALIPVSLCERHCA